MLFSWIPVVPSIIALTQFGDFLNRSVLFHIHIYIYFFVQLFSAHPIVLFHFSKLNGYSCFFNAPNDIGVPFPNCLLLVTLCSEQPMIFHVYIIKFTESQLENCACVLKHSVFIDFSRSITKAILNSNVL